VLAMSERPDIRDFFAICDDRPHGDEDGVIDLTDDEPAVGSKRQRVERASAANGSLPGSLSVPSGDGSMRVIAERLAASPKGRGALLCVGAVDMPTQSTRWTCGAKARARTRAKNRANAKGKGKGRTPGAVLDDLESPRCRRLL